MLLTALLFMGMTTLTTAAWQRGQELKATPGVQCKRSERCHSCTTTAEFETISTDNDWKFLLEIPSEAYSEMGLLGKELVNPEEPHNCESGLKCIIVKSNLLVGRCDTSTSTEPPPDLDPVKLKKIADDVKKAFEKATNENKGTSNGSQTQDSNESKSGAGNKSWSILSFGLFAWWMAGIGLGFGS